MQLTGKVALITGAAGSIGQATARALAAEGAALALWDLRPEVLDVARTLNQGDATCTAAVVDISSRPAVEAAVQDIVRDMGHLDVLFNNAGILNRVPILEMTDAQWDRTLEVNLKGYFITSQVVARQMVKQGGGRIVNVASLAATVLQRDDCAYTASKSGVLGLTRSLAYELAAHNIRVNSISPGNVRTGMNAALRSGEGVEQRLRDRVPIGRLGEPDDIANLVVYLAAYASDYLTGTDVIIDGAARVG